MGGVHGMIYALSILLSIMSSSLVQHLFLSNKIKSIDAMT